MSSSLGLANLQTTLTVSYPFFASQPSNSNALSQENTYPNRQMLFSTFSKAPQGAHL